MIQGFYISELGRSARSILAAILTVGVLFGGVPSFTGIIVVTSNSRPAFGLDICHPIPSADLTSAGVAVPGRPFALSSALGDFGELADPVVPDLGMLRDPPDLPPPK